jgi:hypothetical protein
MDLSIDSLSSALWAYFYIASFNPVRISHQFIG